MKKKVDLKFLFLRYLTLIVLALGNLLVIYAIFTPLTVYLSYLALDLIYGASIDGIRITFSSITVQIVSACVAGAAYYLLIILNLSTPMDMKTRAKSLVFIIFSFLIINVLRIVIFSALIYNDYQYFDLTHKFTWLFGSTLMLVVIWFVNIYIFNIRSIPVVTDVNSILRSVKR